MDSARRLPAREDSGRCARRDGRQSSADLRLILAWLEVPQFQHGQEPAVQSFGVGEEEYCQPLQVGTKLVAQNISGIGEFRCYFR